jgi:hypothetical protein
LAVRTKNEKQDGLTPAKKLALSANVRIVLIAFKKLADDPGPP